MVQPAPVGSPIMSAPIPLIPMVAIAIADTMHMISDGAGEIDETEDDERHELLGESAEKVIET